MRVWCLSRLIFIVQDQEEQEGQAGVYVFNTQRDIWQKSHVELLTMVVKIVHARFGTHVSSDYAHVLRA